MLSLLELFVSVDDFCQGFLPFWERKLQQDGSRKRRWRGQLSVSEIMTIIIYFHQSQYRNFKAYYTKHVCQHLRADFPSSTPQPCWFVITIGSIRTRCLRSSLSAAGVRWAGFMASSSIW